MRSQELTDKSGIEKAGPKRSSGTVGTGNGSGRYTGGSVGGRAPAAALSDGLGELAGRRDDDADDDVLDDDGERVSGSAGSGRDHRGGGSGGRHGGGGLAGFRLGRGAHGPDDTGDSVDATARKRRRADQGRRACAPRGR